MEWAEKEPDIVIGGVGDGGNFVRMTFPFLQGQVAGRARYRIVAVQPRACALLTRETLAMI
ncbi:MAG: hypothetical protein NZ483_06425 [Verrucomicrobiae bacterium]|nr:hypothetical protein [Verrucomicrobiae bacterium]